ncbi:MAG: amino acid adenylation domain-containing protein [Cyanobacteria bacterium P01_G01_bin.38]
MTVAAPPPPEPRSTQDAADWLAESNLTTAQRQLWLGQKLAPESPLYNMAFLFTLSGKIDPVHFQAAFQALVQRCDALRLVIDEVGGVPQQRVLPQLDYTVPVLDLRAKTDPQNAVRVWAEARCQILFDLSEQLFDTALIQLDDDCFVWYLNQHHLTTDGVSLKRVYEVLSDFYQRSIEGTLAQAPTLPAYTETSLPSPSTRVIDYWQQQQAAPVALYHRTGVTTPRSRRVSCELGAERTAALKRLAIDSEAAALTSPLSLFNLIAGILLAYLHRISGNAQVAFSTPAHGRPTKLLKETIGVFIELFPLQAEIESGETFASLLTKVSHASGGLLRHAQPGASEFVADRDVNVVLNFIHASVSDFAGIPVRAEWIHAEASNPHHHLQLLVHDFDNRGSLQLHFDFNCDVFEPGLQDRAPGHFLALLDAVLADRIQAITGVNLLSEPEHNRLSELGRCQQIQVTGTVVQRFEAQVEQTPDAIALICGNETLTYQQLNAQANQLAHYLQQLGVTPETPVGICLRRSPVMLIAIWGVLKTGGAYVPLDPSHPTERISHILKDTQVQWVFTQSGLMDRLEHVQVDRVIAPTVDMPAGEISSRVDLLKGQPEMIWMDRLDLSAQPDDNLSHSPTLEQLAYILYTSGSTGQPKGVEVEHRSLANYVQWAQQQYVRDQKLAFPLFTPLTFDLTVTSIYVPLLSGGQVVIYPEDEAAIDLSLQRICQDNLVDVIKLTPSHLALLQGMSLGSRVKTLILGGEDLKTSLASEIINAGPIEIYNEYGPTEATVGCMIHRFELPDASSDSSASVSIGKPAAGAIIYLLDAHLNQVPWGDVGEIFLGGPGLARGYLNQPELTAERFIQRVGERLYRTSDLGRWEENGELTYLGRCDRQVKIRGHRVEMGEIEATLAAHPEVRDGVVKVVESGQLVAYFVSNLVKARENIGEKDAGFDVSAQPNGTPGRGDAEMGKMGAMGKNAAIADLRGFLAQRLPGNWVPTYFVPLDEMPLTAHGKVDFEALPNPQMETLQAQTTFVAPRTPVEETLAEIWQQVLRADHVGIHDNFFDLGGDSIRAIQIAARMSEAGWVISPNQIFQHSTLAELAAIANPKVIGDTNASPEPGPPKAALPLKKLSHGQLDKLSTLLDQADKARLNQGGAENR